MENNEVCSSPRCGISLEFQRLYKSLPYCEKHYFENLTKDFQHAYEAWASDKSPSEKLQRIMGRMVEEYWTSRNGLMTGARLRDRGFNFEKTPDGFSFQITRHMGAFKYGYVKKRIVQRWHVDIAKKVA